MYKTNISFLRALKITLQINILLEIEKARKFILKRRKKKGK